MGRVAEEEKRKRQADELFPSSKEKEKDTPSLRQVEQELAEEVLGHKAGGAFNPKLPKGLDLATHMAGLGAAIVYYRLQDGQEKILGYLDEAGNFLEEKGEKRAEKTGAKVRRGEYVAD